MLPFRSAVAQTPRFRVTKLCTLGFTPNPDTYGSMGINNKGQCVYGFMVNGSLHAWVWLPSTDYGFTAGFHDISAEIAQAGLARDINESGRIVGQTGSALPGLDSAVVWNLVAVPPDATLLGSLGGTSPWSGAHAINDASPPVVVGDSSAAHDCDCPLIVDDHNDQVARGFRISLDNPLPSMTELAPAGQDSASGARDVMTPSLTLTRISGFSKCSESLPCGSPGTCIGLPDKDGVVWQSASTAVVQNDLGENGAETRAINNARHCVGLGVENGTMCIRRALYWNLPTSAYFNLGSIMPSGQSGQQSRAEGLNNLPLVQVVGWNTEQVFALLWEQPTGGTWIVTDLTSASQACPVPCTTSWTIREAHDINNNGWIIAWAERLNSDCVIERAAVLLTPTPACPYDVVPNNCINTDDLLTVINNWGNCKDDVICIADVNFDCKVNVDDLLAVNNNWCGSSNCQAPCCNGCPGCGGGSAPAGGSSGPLSIAQLVQLVLQSSLPPAQQYAIIQQILAH